MHSPTSDSHADYNKTKLFVISVIALITAGVAASIRASIAGEIKTVFFDPVDPLNSAAMVGSVLGVAFLGFAISIAVGSPLLDAMGMGRVLAIACACFLLGTLVILFVAQIAGAISIYRVIWLGMCLQGIGWGLVETTINPLAATLYPEEKTHRLNVLHAWWPAGLMIGGSLGLMDWTPRSGLAGQTLRILVPAMIFGVMLIGIKFPPTERVAAGVPTSAMFKEVANPFFLIWFFSMFLTAASELAPGQWVDVALTRTVGMQGIWLLIYVSGLMFVMRHFAGPMAHKFSPVGLLWISCLLASLGLFALSFANSPLTGLLAATVWGTGVCYMWPTMLAAASEALPAGRGFVDGIDGNRRHAIDLLCPAKNGADFRSCQNRRGRGRCGFQSFERRQTQ